MSEHGRRGGDYVDGAGGERTREDDLEELLEHGSRNFRRYRRRAYAAFAVLAISNALAIYLASHNGDVARQDLEAAVERQQADLADAGAETAIRACRADNALRSRLVMFVAELEPDLEDRARLAFLPRLCELESRALEREARRGRP